MALVVAEEAAEVAFVRVAKGVVAEDSILLPRSAVR